ncbi:hypothetical protein [Flavobacterium sp. ASW18X]|uniref:hypothetical protein n=1 Tax=Flavobacterium sp. ASW18X TaxID=2572595 RepID=UPI0010AE0216|nr:hypothetical protein [Flavobacterium sp. ASW18X]TKD58992.1 hypothetical protein FBT53_14505 [Flavobacterium sp. ASW18X]
MKMEKNTQKITRHYTSRKKSDIVNFPVPFRRSALSGADKGLAQLPVSSFRILFKILNDISYDQFHPKKQKQQLNLFEEDMLTENNTFASFSFPAKEVDEHLDYRAIEKGLESLENLSKGWHESITSKGKKVKSLGGVISSPQLSEGKVSFLMSAYWIRQLMQLPHYNKALLRTPWELSKGKHVLFYLWLLELPDEGTRVNFHNFQTYYDYNYKDAQSLAKFALKPLKALLDKVSNRSFNYKTSGDLIFFTPYYTKDVQIELKDKTVTNQQITQKLHYWKVRHKLEKTHIDTFRSFISKDKGSYQLFVKAYDFFIKSCKKEKIKATTYTGNDFLALFQNNIEEYYNSTELGKVIPNGFPKVYTDEKV